jgi:hypothetical protein
VERIPRTRSSFTNAKAIQNNNTYENEGPSRTGNDCYDHFSQPAAAFGAGHRLHLPSGSDAQDFYSAFGLGQDDHHIIIIDAEGVALAAIQGLNQKMDSENAALRAENFRFEKTIG